MKICRIVVCISSILYFLVLGSCASHPPAASVPVPRTGPELPKSESPVLTPPPEQVSWITRYIQNNFKTIDNYFILGEASEIIVKARLRENGEDYEITYDLQNAVSEGSVFKVAFLAEEIQSGSTRQDTLLWTIEEDEAGILLAMDDDYQEVWERYFDLFDRYQAKLTFFVTGEYGPFCSKALSRGHDIGYHTFNHLNLLKVSRKIFFEETLAALDGFREAEIPLKAFAYPYGLWEPWMHGELFKSFTVIRGFGTTYRIYNREAIKNGYISSKSIDNIIYKEDAAFNAAVTMMLRTAKFLGRILPLTTHTIADDAAWGIRPDRLEYLLQSAADLKLTFYRYGDF
jgi:peptidoglycan/xylan/chitin deacetylase (PgdA/CDA1 family)